MEPVVISLKWKRSQKTWVAEITGRSVTYGYARTFLGNIGKATAKRRVLVDYALDEGKVYEVCEIGERSFLHVRDGKATKIDKSQVLKIIAETEKAEVEARRMVAGEIDNVIARFNSEGGFSNN